MLFTSDKEAPPQVMTHAWSILRGDSFYDMKRNRYWCDVVVAILVLMKLCHRTQMRRGMKVKDASAIIVNIMVFSRWV